MRLTPIHTVHPSYSFVERLLEQAFPPEERRDSPAQRANTDGNPLFHCCLIENDAVPCGVITYWDFGDFCYVEHFAVAPEQRGKGLGAQALGDFLAMVRRPVILEVELPRDDISRRRIAFYERRGLKLWGDVPYVQPPYREGSDEVEMMLMAYGSLDSARDLRRVRSRIYSEVYGVTTEGPCTRHS